MKWIILLSVVLFAASCSNESAVIPTAKSSLKVDLKASSLKAGYKRGQAPVYIAGVTLTADNTEYTDVANVTKTFMFKSDKANDGDDIVLEGLTVGTNSITAVGVCDIAKAKNGKYTGLALPSGSTPNDRADDYAEVLRGEQAIYANYVSSEAEVIDISNVGNNAITVDMVTNNHRVAVVLENPEGSEYDLKWTVLEGENVLMQESDFMNADEREAFVINSAAAVDGKTYTVKVNYYTKVTHELMVGKTITKEIAAISYDNITKVFHFSKGDLLEGVAKTTFTWEPLVVKNSGEDIQ